MGPKAGERKRGVLARDDDKVGERRSLLDEDAQEGVDWFRGDDLVVIEDEHERVVSRRDRVDQDRGCLGAGAAVEQGRGQAVDPRPQGRQGGGEVAQEANRVVVGRRRATARRSWCHGTGSSPATAALLPYPGGADSRVRRTASSRAWSRCASRRGRSA